MDKQVNNTVDTTLDAFEQDVVERSHHQLVLVDFWADWCGPCKSLAPVLDRLLDQYAGSVCLARVNTDEQQELATRYGIRSLPTVMLFKNGEVVDQFMGAQPENMIKPLLDKHVARESDKHLERALVLFDSGDHDGAIALLQRTVAQDAANDRPKFKLLEWLLNDRRYDEARTVCNALTAEGKDNALYRSLKARLELVQDPTEGPGAEELIDAIEQDAGNLEARFQLANHLVRVERLPEALDQLIEIIKRDRTFRDDAPRQTVLKIFDLAGGRGPLVSQYRSLLSQALN